MRGQPGPGMALGNYPAVRRYVRGRRPPPVILWSIGIITILLFIGAAAMLTVGYLNPFGTVGLAILGVGAVVYFGAIFFLVLSCLWVERKYPGMQPLSFKIYSKKTNRMPPTAFTNPNTSGQMPDDTTPNYRLHNELPIQVPGSNEEGGTTDESQENNPPSHGSSGHAKNPKGQSSALDILPEEDHNGGNSEEDNPDISLQARTNNDNINLNKDSTANLISAAEMEEKAQLKTKHAESAVETEGMDQNKTAQDGDDDNASAGSKNGKKVRFKTHHIEVPFEDYPLSDSSVPLKNKKGASQGIPKANPKENSQHISTSTENEISSSTGASKSPSSTKTSTTDKQKEASSSVNNQSQASDDHPPQRTKTAALSAANIKDFKQESSNTSSTPKSRFIKKEEKPQDGSQSTSSSQPAGSSPVDARKQILRKPQNNQENLPGVKALTPTNSVSPPTVRKVTERESHASKLPHLVPKDTALMPKLSTVNATKMLDVLKNKDHPQESGQEKSQTSSPSNIGEHMPPHRNNRHDQQNLPTALKPQTQRAGSPNGSPTRVQKVQSPEMARKLRKDNSVLNSPPANGKFEGASSPSRHPQEKPDDFSTGQRTQEQSISSRGRTEEIQKKKILHSSQSNDFPSSSSPPRLQHKSPNGSPRLPRNRDHTSRTAAFHSSPTKEVVSNMQSHHSTPSSSRDIPASPSSSPRRTLQKNLDLSNIPEIHKRHTQPSSQTSDISSSPTSSPLSSKRPLQIKKEQTNQSNPNKSVPQQRTDK